MSQEKTDVVWIGAHIEEVYIEPDEKARWQNDSFLWLDGAVCNDGRSEVEVRIRVQLEGRCIYI